MNRAEASVIPPESDALTESNVAHVLKTIGEIVNGEYVFPVEVKVYDSEEGVHADAGLSLTKEELREVSELLKFDRRGPVVTFEPEGGFELIHRSTRSPMEFIEHYHKQGNDTFTAVYLFRYSRSP